MVFDTQPILANHQNKFCQPYNNLQQLEQQFQQHTQGRDISLFGRLSLVHQNTLPNVDKEYQSLLQQIHNNQASKQRYHQQKIAALQQLEGLDSKESQLMVQKKRLELHELNLKKQQMQKQEEQLEREIKSFQNKSKIDSPNIHKPYDPTYQQAKASAKIQLQRKLYEQQLSDIQQKLSHQKRLYQKTAQQLKNSKASSIQQLSNLLQLNTSPKYHNKLSPQISNLKESKGISNWKESKHISEANNNKSKSEYSFKTVTHKQTIYPYSDNVKEKGERQAAKIIPQNFKFSQKTLAQLVNRNNKSQEDILMQTILAQQYDNLNLLAQLPKNSQLYNIKMRQFAEMSQLREQIRQKIYAKKTQKMKRQFENQLVKQHLQRQNALYVDQKRKAMMGKQTQIIQSLKNHQQKIQGNWESTQNIPQEQNLPKIFNNGEQEHIKINRKINKARKPQSILYNPTQNGQQQRTPNSTYQKPKDNELWGYKVTIHSLKNYTREKPIKFKITIYEEGLASFKQQFWTSYHDAKASQYLDPLNPNRNDKQSIDGKIIFEESFIFKQNLQQLHSNSKNELYLLIMLSQQKENKISANEPQLYAWYSFKITHFGKIRQGRYTFNLYSDELVYHADMNQMKKKLKEQIEIQLQQVILLGDTQPARKVTPLDSHKTFQQRKITTPVQSIHNKTQNKTNFNPTKSQILRKSISSDQSSKKISKNKSRQSADYRQISASQLNLQQKKQTQYFIQNISNKCFNPIKPKQQLNFDFAISQLRTLPSYIGPIKIQISFIDDNSILVTPKQQMITDLQTDFYNPQLHYTIQIRKVKNLPPSTQVFIRILAINTLDYQTYMLGFAKFHLFYDQKLNPYNSKKKPQQLLLVDGLFQLHIYYGACKPFSSQPNEIEKKYPALPCSSILIGVIQNESEEQQSQLPQYQTGQYNTIMFRPNKLQLQLFDQQYKRDILDSKKHIRGFLQYKGIKKDFTTQQAQNYLFKSLQFNDNNLQTFNVNAMAQYQAKFGVYFLIDKIHLDEGYKNYFYYVTVCVSPPGYYYHKKQNDLNYIYKVNGQVSTNKDIYFTNGVFHLPLQYNQKAVFIIEVNRINLSEGDQQEDKIQSYSHVVIPIFNNDSEMISVNVSKDTIEMFDGDLDFQQIDKIENDLQQYISKRKKAKGINLSYRLMNGYFPNQYKFEPTITNGKKFESYLPNEMTLQEITQQVGSLISKTYNIQLQ